MNETMPSAPEMQPQQDNTQPSRPVAQHNSLQPDTSSNAHQPQPQPQPSDPRPTQHSGPGRDWLAIARRRFSLIGATIVAMMLIWLVTAETGGAILRSVFGDDAPMWATVLVSSGTIYLIAMPLSMLIATRVPVLRTAQYPMRAGEFLRILIMVVAVGYVGNIIGTVLSLVLSRGQSSNRIIDILAGGDWWVNVLFIVVLAPIFEEWMFRQQLISRLRRYGEKTAILYSALAFALFHYNLYQFFYAFGMGLLLGYVYTRTLRLRYPILMHMLFNLNGSVVGPLIIRQVDPHFFDGSMSNEELLGLVQTADARLTGLGYYSLYVMVLLALTIAGIVLLIVRRKSWEFYTAPEELPAGRVARTAYGNIGTISYLLLTIALTGVALLM